MSTVGSTECRTAPDKRAGGLAGQRPYDQAVPSTRVALLCFLLAVCLGCRSPQPEQADTLRPLDLEQIRTLTGAEWLGRGFDISEPAEGDGEQFGGCQALSEIRSVYGDDWQSFRAVGDSGPEPLSPAPTTQQPEPGRPQAPVLAKPRMVVLANQAVASYPDADRAREVFDRRVEFLRECAASDEDAFTGAVRQSDPQTVTYTSSVSTIVFAIRATDLISVLVMGLPDNETAASGIVAAILGEDD